MTAQEKPAQEVFVTHVGGAGFRIEVRRHEILVDQPVGATAGGFDMGPTPTELFVASVAGCAAYYGRTYLARRSLPDRVDVVARWQFGAKPDRVAHIHLLVDAPGVPSDRADVFRRVVENCLVHNTLANPPDVEFELKRSWHRGQPIAG